MRLCATRSSRASLRSVFASCASISLAFPAIRQPARTMGRTVTKKARTEASAVPVARTGLAGDMLDFINQAWTPYHAVEEASKRLVAAGFQHINEKLEWDVQAGGRQVACIFGPGMCMRASPGCPVTIKSNAA